ncbi:hypothetical protein ACILDU_03880 [Capnocytophaga canimorsus]|uniref:hypothetical protein n=1 Tax=Capnocytophaga canimorsus TaxID=28188 RepID=UPI0037CFD52C
MNGVTIYHVQFSEGENYYFGSISAIYDHFTKEELGISKNSLWNFGIEENKPYKNRKCTIFKGIIHRKKGNRNVRSNHR